IEWFRHTRATGRRAFPSDNSADNSAGNKKAAKRLLLYQYTTAALLTWLGCRGSRRNPGFMPWV
ncbi:MAG: hypothetical protein ACPGGD_02480, partial [Thalassolituus sp.]